MLGTLQFGLFVRSNHSLPVAPESFVPVPRVRADPFREMCIRDSPRPGRGRDMAYFDMENIPSLRGQHYMGNMFHLYGKCQSFFTVPPSAPAPEKGRNLGALGSGRSSMIGH